MDLKQNHKMMDETLLLYRTTQFVDLLYSSVKMQITFRFVYQHLEVYFSLTSTCFFQPVRIKQITDQLGKKSLIQKE